MWNYIKRGFGYGLGGRIGWELGGLVWGLVRKLIALIALAVGATWGLPMLGDSVGAYNDLQQKYAQQGAGHAQR
ncbi:MAG: hypothetical protein ACLGHA_09735 [Gammaproteobacteria bacterium]